MQLVPCPNFLPVPSALSACVFLCSVCGPKNCCTSVFANVCMCACLFLYSEFI